MITDKSSHLLAKALDRHVGGRLARRRLELGLPALALDKALSVSPGSTARFETGERGMTAAQLFALSGFLKVPVIYFFEGAPALLTTANGDNPSPALVKETKSFLGKFLRIRDIRVRRGLLALVKAAGRGLPS